MFRGNFLSALVINKMNAEYLIINIIFERLLLIWRNTLETVVFFNFNLVANFYILAFHSFSTDLLKC